MTTHDSDKLRVGTVELLNSQTMNMLKEFHNNLEAYLMDIKDNYSC